MPNHLLSLPRNSAQRTNTVAEAWGEAWGGNRRVALDVAEALSTSDFQQATGDVLHRELLTRYQDITPTWSGYVRRTTVADFKPKTFVDILGGRTGLDRVPELSEYPARDSSKGEYQIRAGKFGSRFAVSFEAIVNDELGEIRQMPANLAAAARDEESKQAAQLLVKADGNGPNTAFFKSASGNAPDNKPLTADNLDAAITKASQAKDSDGRPVVMSGFVLVVPTGLETTARRILSAQEFRTTDANGQVTVSGNFLAGRVDVVVDPWLQVVNTAAKAAATWYVLPKPAGRPALAIAFMTGREVPDLRVKADTGSRAGGGSITPEEGSFDIDDVQYRVRHILGTATLDPAGTYVSTGS